MDLCAFHSPLLYRFASNKILGQMYCERLLPLGLHRVPLGKRRYRSINHNLLEEQPETLREFRHSVIISMGKRHFQIRESKRRPFRASVEIRWVDSEGQSHRKSGTSVDVSAYGLGIIVPVQLPAEEQLTVTVSGVEVCGGAVVRHSHACESGFKVGLYFRLTLLMQNIPGIDALLEPSLSARRSGAGHVVTSLTLRLVLRFWRRMTGNARRAIHQLRSARQTARLVRGTDQK